MDEAVIASQIDPRIKELRLKDIQREQCAWSLSNFGEQTTGRMALGLIEELGEVEEAWAEDNIEKLFDAIGDVGIYMLNYCNIVNWDIAKIFAARTPCNPDAQRYPQRVTPLMRAIAHHQLKGEQNIRGGSAHHARQMELTLCHVLYQIDQLSYRAMPCGDFFTILDSVWVKVSKRDWVKNPDNADVVAEEQEIKDA